MCLLKLLWCNLWKVESFILWHGYRHLFTIKNYDMGKYKQLFTIPIATCTASFPGNIDMVFYDIISGIYREIERSFKIYCKLDGQLKKQFSLRGSMRDSVRFCGCDRLVIQKQYTEGMKIFDISSEVPRLIRKYLFFHWTGLSFWTRNASSYAQQKTFKANFQVRWTFLIFKVRVWGSVDVRSH